MANLLPSLTHSLTRCVVWCGVVQPGSEGRPGVELEKSLSSSLHKLLELVEEASALLDYYKGEREERERESV